MPSKTPSQARFMAACAHNAGYDSCPPMKVAKEFNQADKGGKMLKAKRPHSKGVLGYAPESKRRKSRGVMGM